MIIMIPSSNGPSQPLNVQADHEARQRELAGKEKEAFIDGAYWMAKQKIDERGYNCFAVVLLLLIVSFFVGLWVGK